MNKLEKKKKRKTVPKVKRYLVHEKYDGHCAYCGCEIRYAEMQIDFVKNNGDTELENLMPSCRMCKYFKGTKNADKFRRELGLVLVRLKKDSLYRLALKYARLTEHPDNKIEFYYEKHKK